MKQLFKMVICSVLLMAGLSSCEDLVTEINLADNLEGSWQKEYPKGVQDAGQVIWTFSVPGDISDIYGFTLDIYVSDVQSGDSEAKYIYVQHQNGYPGVGSSTPEIYLFDLDHDFMAEDGKVAYTPTAIYFVKECSKDKLILQLYEINSDGPNLLEKEMTFKRVK